jgi:hypothetical protein
MLFRRGLCCKESDDPPAETDLASHHILYRFIDIYSDL